VPACDRLSAKANLGSSHAVELTRTPVAHMWPGSGSPEESGFGNVAVATFAGIVDGNAVLRSQCSGRRFEDAAAKVCSIPPVESASRKLRLSPSDSGPLTRTPSSGPLQTPGLLTTAGASRPSGRFSTTSTPEGVQPVCGSHVDFPVGDSWRRQNLAIKLVFCQDLQLRTAIEHNHHALLRRNVDLVVGGDR
jgi:hypothetical protein